MFAASQVLDAARLLLLALFLRKRLDRVSRVVVWIGATLPNSGALPLAHAGRRAEGEEEPVLVQRAQEALSRRDANAGFSAAAGAGMQGSSL